MAAHQASPSLGFSRQEHWSELPFPSPMHKSEKWKRSRSVVSDPVRPQRQQPTRLLCPWDSPGKNTVVGCHFLLQELPYDPAIPLLGIHTEETRIERDMGTPMFITALFIIARTWKQPRCPSVDEWIRKLWYICTMEYYSAIKKNTFEPVLMRWIKLEPIMQSEVSQKEKHQYSILKHIYGI